MKNGIATKQVSRRLIMTNEEKILLVELLLKDLRLNWADKTRERADKACSLCKELGFTKLAEVISAWDECDGRYFRYEYPEGYEGMGKLHSLEYTYQDKSDGFKYIVIGYLTYPDMLFTDWYI